MNLRERNFLRTHYVYTLEGPSGVYVGCTNDPISRERNHRSRGRPSKVRQQHWADLQIHLAMREDGEGSYAFRVVSEHLTLDEGVEAERKLIVELRATGKHVFNLRPRPGSFLLSRYERGCEQ